MPRQGITEVFERCFVEILVLLIGYRLGIPNIRCELALG